jgi:hypothetical protein
MRLFLVGVFLFLQTTSQPPAPTPHKASYTNKGQTKQEQNKADTDNHRTQELIVTINRLTSAIAARNQQQAQSDTKGAPAISNTWNIFVAVFTGILCVVAGLQWRTMDRQSKYLQSAERAHIDLDFIGDTNAYTIMIANYGKSIANIVEYSFSHGVYPLTEKDISREKATTLHEDFMPMNAMLQPTGPKEFWRFDLRHLFAKQSASDKIIIRGTIVYYDIFEERHHTEVVYESWGPTMKTLPGHNRYT